MTGCYEIEVYDRALPLFFYHILPSHLVLDLIVVHDLHTAYSITNSLQNDAVSFEYPYSRMGDPRANLSESVPFSSISHFSGLILGCLYHVIHAL